MMNLPNETALRTALDQPLTQELKTLLEERLADMLHCGLQEHTHIVVMGAADTETQLIAATGFSPLCSEEWEWLERHGGWWELLHCVGDFAYILLIEDSDTSLPARLCRQRKGGMIRKLSRPANRSPDMAAAAAC